jgi:SAM-dependent methyltransferase
MTKVTNHTRVCRILDFVMPDDRILEVGVNRGYITGMIMREVAIGGYVGIDLTDHQIDAARQMAKIYAPASLPIHFEVKNLYELTPEWADAHNLDLVLLLEVLEHVPDAERALTTLAACVRDDTAILFSVPTYGRLETVWGHVSIFDSNRVRGLCEQAGLVAQHVEVLQDQWVFVLATKARAVPSRLFEVISRPTAASPAAPVVCEFVPIPIDSIALIEQSHRRITLDYLSDDSVRVTNGSRRRPRRRNTVGLQFPLAGDTRLRLELSFETPTNIRRVRVKLRGADGNSTAQWMWNCGAESQVGKKTFVLRPGKKFGPFKPVGVATPGGAGRAITAELVVEAKSARKALSFTLHRVAAASKRTPTTPSS